MDYEKYTAALKILNDYLHSLEDNVNKASIVDGESEPPFVIIGSTVEVRESSGRALSFTVMLPGNGSPGGLKGGSQHVSCLGACGRTLLLKQLGEKVAFETAEGKVTGVIERIIYDMKL